jgi:F-type H+-transporting ATPase subunit b
MLINWFTVAAQAINFLILVWLLKRFLYRPILHAIDEREKGIAAQLADVEATKAEATKDRDDYRHKNDVLDEERAGLLRKAADDASSERQRLLDEARREADALRSKRQDALRTEQRNLSRDITRWTRDQVFDITRKTLTDLAGTGLEERIGDVFVRRVRALNGAAREQLATAFKASNRAVSVHSAFDLPPAQRGAIESAVRDTFAPDARIRFETAPEVVSGIELSTNGHKIAWSIADYLSTLEKSAGELLLTDATPGPKPEANSKPDSKPKPKAEAEAKPEPKANPGPEPKAGVRPGAQPVPSIPKGTP